jgi:hypothetical protein
MKQIKQVRVPTFLATAGLALIAACGSMPEIATDVSYCCEDGAESIASFRVEFEDTPEFLKPMLRDEAAIVLGAKGLEYTEGTAHSVLRMTFINRTLSAEEERELDSWEKVAPGGGVRFIAEVQLELKNTVTSELLWSGSMRRIHNVYEGSYMHDSPARAAMRQAFMDIFADYPNQKMDNP